MDRRKVVVSSPGESVMADAAPEIARGVEIATAIVENDKALQALIDTGEAKSIIFEIFAWPMGGATEPSKLTHRNGE